MMMDSDPKKPLVAIMMGSVSDAKDMKSAKDMMESLEIPCLARVISAHRTPEETVDFAKSCESNGIEVIIAGAGASAALPGVVAAHTLIPVIGVPLNSTSVGGLDALLSIVQMPGGVPVASMAIGSAGAKNAALFAARILAIKYKHVRTRLENYASRVYREAQEKIVDPFC